MAERRMFAKSIVLSDAFLDMPLTARCLYFTLGMFADDDGFVNSPKGIMRQCGASQDDLTLLLSKKFLLAFESGVIVIKHWRINNYLRSDRYQGTKYIEEKEQLVVNENGSYSLGIPKGGVPSIGKDSIGKDSIGKDSIDKDNNIYITQQDDSKPKVRDRKTIPPTLEEVSAYCKERKNNVNAQAFIDHYESNGWMVGKTKMKDWQAAVRTWEHDNYSSKGGKPVGRVRCVAQSDKERDRERELEEYAEKLRRGEIPDDEEV